MTQLATPPSISPTSQLVPVTALQPLDEIAGPDQPHGPWLVVSVVPSSSFDRIVVIDEHGDEHEAGCQPGQLVRRRNV
jgi:hypothetical protein